VNPKLASVEGLAAELPRLQQAGRRVVLCHGVYDLVHIGHIKHFEAAKRMGDVLVVAVTPDRHLDSDAGATRFNEELRREALAALAVVDYVVLSPGPTAVELLGTLKPDLYVKGGEPPDPVLAAAGPAAEEERVLAEYGGRLAFTDEVAATVSRLSHPERAFLPKETNDYLESFAARYPRADILRQLDQARGLKVLVVGETILDEYQYCTAIGKSSKEPTLVVKSLSSERFAGGILAVANHVAGFCDDVTLLSVLGDQNPQEEFVRASLLPNVRPTLLRRKDAPTIVKRRLIESYFFTKMMEVYEINDVDLDEEDNARFCDALGWAIDDRDLVIVADYGHGLLSREAIGMLSSQSRFLALNAQANAGNLGYHTISMYPRADFVATTENEIRLDARDRRGDLQSMIRSVARRFHCNGFAITRGKAGCLCYLKEEKAFVEIPAFAGRVVDRIGAGDAFLSVSSLLAVQRAPIEVVGFVGNVAGALAVGIVGNKRPIDRRHLTGQIHALLK